jgi:hypothetical protein
MRTHAHCAKTLEQTRCVAFSRVFVPSDCYRICFVLKVHNSVCQVIVTKVSAKCLLPGILEGLDKSPCCDLLT